MAAFNYRIVIIGQDGAQHRKLADAIGETAFENVSHHPGPYDQLATARKIGWTHPRQREADETAQPYARSISAARQRDRA
jgi:hypothetical protein